jgi:hypothetical protein
LEARYYTNFQKTYLFWKLNVTELEEAEKGVMVRSSGLRDGTVPPAPRRRGEERSDHTD